MTTHHNRTLTADTITDEDRERKERVRLIYARQDASERIERVIRAALASFGDDLDRKLILDSVDRAVVRIRAEVAW